MKKIFLSVTLFTSLALLAQDKMITKTGKITFEASVPAFEEVKAKNDGVTCVLNSKTGEIASLALMKGFRFKLALMEEHFNENYMESSQYPKATFKGKVLNFSASKLSSTKSTYDLEGDLTIHGVTKKIKTKINLSLNSGNITATSNFTVKAEDYKIEIPGLVKDKFAENIKITINFNLEGGK